MASVWCTTVGQLGVRIGETLFREPVELASMGGDPRVDAGVLVVVGAVV